MFRYHGLSPARAHHGTAERGAAAATPGSAKGLRSPPAVRAARGRGRRRSGPVRGWAGTRHRSAAPRGHLGARAAARRHGRAVPARGDADPGAAATEAVDRLADACRVDDRRNRPGWAQADAGQITGILPRSAGSGRPGPRSSPTSTRPWPSRSAHWCWVSRSPRRSPGRSSSSWQARYWPLARRDFGRVLRHGFPARRSADSLLCGGR